MPALSDLARLVRAPAALTVPGDVLAGAAAARSAPGPAVARPALARSPVARPAVAGTIASSVCLYWAGMALNDVADRGLDAVERPERPIPSGAVSARAAFGAAIGLSIAGLGLAAAAGGRRGLRIALPLTCVIWSYDFVLKPTAAAPAAMAAARSLNVLAGAAPGRTRQAVPAAVIIGAHTAAVTLLSRQEVHPRSAAVPCLTLATTGVIGAVAAGRGLLPGLLSAAYCGSYGRAQLGAIRHLSVPTVRAAVAAGIHGLIPLQAALIAARGSSCAALAVAGLLPLARRLGRRVSPT
jgi:4-hydroxybenzoate polyprenyltransferase